MRKITVLLIIGLVAAFHAPLFAWEHHTLFTGPLVSNMPEVAGLPPVEVVSLAVFLTDLEDVLEEVLAEQEAWARSTLAAYAPRPEALAFQATGDPSDVRHRFLEAIRVNPDSKMALYLSRLVDDPDAERTGMDLAEVTLFTQSSELRQFSFDRLSPGDLVHPTDILTTASHEPDYGFDIGLFEDNDTEFGLRYGFGEQPFGDPNLDYGSQAPFHMGFYHESWLVFLFAPFLKETYPEYRIHLYKTLSETAFEQGHDYWGWRFMGWGLHYMADLAMPYHSTVLPGYSTIRMLWINLLDMLGFPQPVSDALQLVSNQHMAFERYQGIRYERLARAGEEDHLLFEVMRQATEAPPYTDCMPRKQVARQSNAMARCLYNTLTAYMPARFVSDPSIELGEEPDLNEIVELVEEAHGPEAITMLDEKIVNTLVLFNIYGRSFIEALLPQ